jgi:hypothetical protein
MLGTMKKHLDWAAVKAAAHQLGVKPRTVEKWQEAGRGVPHKYWWEIVQEADGRVTIEALKRSRE